MYLCALKKSSRILFILTVSLFLGNCWSETSPKKKSVFSPETAWGSKPPFICHAFPTQRNILNQEAREIIKKAKNNSNYCDLKKFIESTQTQGLLPNFSILCLEDESAENAYCISYDSINVIVYAPTFIKSLNISDPKGYKQKFVLLHEIGHLIKGHKKSTHAAELEADDFAGKYMYVLGSFLPEAISAIDDNKIINEATETHPDKKSRIESVRKGWLNAEYEGLPRIPSPWFIDSFQRWYPFEHIVGGEFIMGAAKRDLEAANDEKPPEEVEVEPFHIGRYEVTQELWNAIMGTNPSYHSGCKKCPVESISYREVQNFISKLNSITGRNFRLPYEKEWEYAAKNGFDMRNYLDNINDISWNVKNAKNTMPVGAKKHNKNVNIYDMIGNVAEWCGEPYRKYKDAKVHVQPGLWSQRGGGVYFSTENWQWGYRLTTRYKGDPSTRDKNVGFRLVLDIQ